MMALSLFLIAAPGLLLVYAVAIYPVILWLLTRNAPPQAVPAMSELPSITITIPVYNEEKSIASTLRRLLELDYPAEKRQILVVSDASTDHTDEIVESFSTQGVEMLRMPARRGKTAAESAAVKRARGEIIVNIDATILLQRDALARLVRAFDDETVGVASGRDVSVGDTEREGSASEAGYVGYEMWVRALETRLHSIVGASGCFFATRTRLFERDFPEHLSRDFASALIAREQGFRAVSVHDAVCLVPRARSLRAEFARKVRTMARGLATLEYKRHLLDTQRFGVFAWMLFSHKLCRWLVYTALPFSFAGAAALATLLGCTVPFWLATFLAACVFVVSIKWPEERQMPRLLGVAGYLVLSNTAGMVAWWKFLSRERDAVWEPTRR
jgi:cellulose synthase/poly-beta-1,6-N-acetylglucosamine synthase-like glycosyltransferase